MRNLVHRVMTTRHVLPEGPAPKTAASFPVWEAKRTVDDQPAVITPRIRNDVLEYASALTVDHGNPSAVIANAEPLLAWLAEAITQKELDARAAALRRQFHNTPNRYSNRTDDPQALLAGAQTLHEFLRPQDLSRQTDLAQYADQLARMCEHSAHNLRSVGSLSDRSRDGDSITDNALQALDAAAHAMRGLSGELTEPTAH